MIPEGYEKLAVIGIAWKDEYVQDTAYKTMNGVYYQGSTYVALRDNPTGPPVADGANWQYLAKGFVAALLNMIDATDTSGVLGTAGAEVGAQDLMDAIADRVMTKLVAKNQIVNNLLATVPGNVLDATQGKALKDDVTSLYSDLTKVGEVITGDVKTGIVFANGQSHVLASITLPNGKWIIFARINMGYANGKTAAVDFSIASDCNASCAMYTPDRDAWERQMLTGYETTGGRTIYVTAVPYGNLGTDQVLCQSLYAVRLK